MSTVVAVINPARRHAVEIQNVLHSVCARAGFSVVDVVHTTVQEPGFSQARWAVEQGADRVVVAGGDGTVRQVAGGVAKTSTGLVIMPTGTANLFAMNVGLKRRRPGDLAALERDLEAGLRAPLRAHDVGRVRFHPATSTKSGPSGDLPAGGEFREQVFLAAAGLGMDAVAVAATSESTKQRWGWLAYLRNGADLLNAPRQNFRVAVDGDAAQSLAAWSLLWGNTARIPAGITVFPGADPHNGTLEMLRTEPRNSRDWVDLAVHGLRRRPRSARALTYRTVHQVQVKTHTPAALQLDGDSLGATRALEVWVDPGSLYVAAAQPPRPRPSPGPRPNPTP